MDIQEVLSGTEELCEEFNSHHKSSHDAFDDVSATAELLMRAIREKIAGKD